MPHKMKVLSGAVIVVWKMEKQGVETEGMDRVARKKGRKEEKGRKNEESP